MLNNLDKIIQDGVNKGLLQNATNQNPLDSAEIHIDEELYLNFGSCSYLGLEFHKPMKEAVKLAVDQYGTQFSTSRAYLSLGLYDELEKELTKIFKKPLLVVSSTTLGHLAALPVIIEEGDAVILDFQVHASIQMTAQILKANKIPIHLIPHNDMDSLEAKIRTLSSTSKRIWYLADGVYSMYGDFSPLSKIQTLLKQYKKLFLYIDDAHGMGWTGENGIGYVRSQMKHHDRMVMISSLNKSFAASGGVLIFPNKEMQRKVKNCGTTVIFSGPIQPPMLGACLASAKLHQSKQFILFQDELKSKIAFTNKLLMQLDLPQYEPSDSPLFFIPVGLPRIILTIIDRMKKKGYYLNSAGYPATPMKKGGLRFMINNRLKKDQIEKMLTSLKKEYVLGLFSEGSSPEYVAKQFKIKPFLKNHGFILNNKKKICSLKSNTYESINSIDREQWNSLFTAFGSNEYQNLKELTQVFEGSIAIENNWDINYHIIRDSKGEIVLASIFTIALMMDDLFMGKELSQKIKEMRRNDKYYLTSNTIISGTPFTKGKSLHLNYDHESWKEALKIHVELLTEVADFKSCSKIILRDFYTAEKNRLENPLMELGLLEMELPNNFVVDDINWKDTDALLARLTQKYRYSLRKEILKKEDLFDVRFERPKSEKMKRYTYKLYQNVYHKSTEISVFELPFALFEKMYQDSTCDFIYLFLKDKPENPIAVMISQIIDNCYNAQVVGLDYLYVKSHGSYKQILYQTVKRAKKIGCIKVDLAFTAEMEKKKVGAIPQKNHAFFMALEHESFAEMQRLK